MKEGKIALNEYITWGIPFTFARDQNKKYIVLLSWPVP